MPNPHVRQYLKEYNRKIAKAKRIESKKQTFLAQITEAVKVGQDKLDRILHHEPISTNTALVAKSLPNSHTSSVKQVFKTVEKGSKTALKFKLSREKLHHLIRNFENYKGHWDE